MKQNNRGIRVSQLGKVGYSFFISNLVCMCVCAFPGCFYSHDIGMLSE